MDCRTLNLVVPLVACLPLAAWTQLLPFLTCRTTGRPDRAGLNTLVKLTVAPTVAVDGALRVPFWAWVVILRLAVEMAG